MDGGLTHAVVAELGRVTLVIFWLMYKVASLFGQWTESSFALRSVLGTMEEATITTFDPPTAGLVGEEAKGQ